MKINADLIESENGNKITIELSPYDILHDLMSSEQRQALIESLSCHDEIIHNVMEQLINGYTYNGFKGTWSRQRTGALQIAKQRIIEEGNELFYKDTLADLNKQVASLEKDVEYWRNECFRRGREESHA